MQILTLCTANYCRSPMAQALLQRAFDRFGLTVEVSSAGTSHYVANDMHHLTREVLEADGFMLVPRRPRMVTDDMVQTANLVLVMEEGHRQWFIKRYPASRHKVMLIDGENRTDIPDPMGQGKPAFEHLYQQINHLCEQWPQRLVDMGLINQPGT